VDKFEADKKLSSAFNSWRVSIQKKDSARGMREERRYKLKNLGHPDV
jgi:hypothetical protein